MKLKIKRLKSSKIYTGKVLNFFTDKISINNVNAIREYVTYPNAVGIIPLIEDDKIVMIKQYRYTNNVYSLEIPAGKCEGKESLIKTAKRELAEETGYTAKNFIKLLEYYPCISYSTEKLHIFMAKDLVKKSIPPDSDEFFEVQIIKINEILKLIKKNEITDSKTILSILFFYEYYYKNVSKELF